MHLIRLRSSTTWLAAVLVLALTPLAGRAQQAKPTKVRFETVDGVELRGLFYSSSKKADAPCVILLHAIGQNSDQKGWDSLAVTLQKQGFAVLSFDFRGHGKSTSVNGTEFWANPVNQKAVKGFSATKPRETINFKDFNPADYYQYLINDIAAAKAFLDSKNDQNECNSSNLILIGAETGATLGALWMKEEQFRYRVKGPPLRSASQLDPRPESKDVVCAVWLSMSSSLGRLKISPGQVLYGPVREKKMPMIFLYGAKDEEGRRIATSAANVLKGTDKKLRIGGKKIDDSANLKGHLLLRDSLGTEKAIVDFLEKTMEKGLNEFESREFKKQDYVWLLNRRLIPAKRKGEKSLMFIPANLFK